ncbi:flagellar basal-body rod protein FlgF [Massilia sp. TS11]|uniref:flagellar basal-body rod protein FlgF n=1 Tax=Massilia sp. TS11 TaxID=2908003 RepID=UPI001EDB4002|nr:flagellar basal-body rod protein FlgF [Massilia sp. TS11]MCG2582859.1 flagellar basal-body rod protein FlgF [Massilia sp. TS11]
MDRLVYTAASGAKQIMDRQATVAHNLANVSTSGFKAQLDTFRAVPIQGEGLPTRTLVVANTVGADLREGPTQTTGRDLDVAVRGQGWIAVQTADGSEAYTRAGGLKISDAGILQTANGLNVVGDGGPIAIPPEVTVQIGGDGTVASIATTTKPGASTVLGRIKLVNPPGQDMVRGDDGLFRVKDGQPAALDPNVQLASGVLEGSNVNPVDAMVDMIGLARAFDMQMSMLKNAENNEAKATQLLALT